jgi:8-oxo-dGTP pyrophosphatase MutT (NUDIX family)
MLDFSQLLSTISLAAGLLAVVHFCYPKKVEDKKTWRELAEIFKYEGASIMVQNENEELLFMTSRKEDGTLQAEIPGGKPEMKDREKTLFNSMVRTALRELKEETDLTLTCDDIDLTMILQILGGKSKQPAYSMMTKKLPSSIISNVKLESKFMKPIWSKVYRTRETNDWFTRDGEQIIPLRKYNIFVFEQNCPRLANVIINE